MTQAHHTPPGYPPPAAGLPPGNDPPSGLPTNRPAADRALYVLLRMTGVDL